jgi:hypothetical protein
MLDYVNPDVAGSSRVSRKELTRRLGPNALLVWSLLTRRRDARGYAHPTVWGLASSREGEQLTFRTTQRALDRLRAAGLVEDVGLRFLEGVLGKDGFPVEVYMRRVFGAWAGRGEVLVPIHVWPKLMALKPYRGHGGARTGAGGYNKYRLKPDKEKRGVGIVSFKWRDGGAFTPLDHQIGASSGVKGRGSSGVPIVGKDPCLGGDAFPSERHSRFAAELEEGKSVTRRIHEALVPQGLPAHLDKAWRQLLAKAPPAGVRTIESLMPMHPEQADIHVTIPPPPRIPVHLDENDQLVFCAKWYRAAVESRGCACPPLAPLRSHRRYFEDFREVCLEKNIRPGAWVAWALDRVMAKLPKNARARFRPQIKVLLSPTTLTEHRWMFREQEADYSTPTLQLSRAGEDFMAKWRSAKLELLPPERRTQLAAAQVLATMWPEGYKQARERCRENTAAEGQEVRERIQLGEWIWGLPKRLRGARGSNETERRQDGAALRLG